MDWEFKKQLETKDNLIKLKDDTIKTLENALNLKDDQIKTLEKTLKTKDEGAKTLEKTIALKEEELKKLTSSAVDKNIFCSYYGIIWILYIFTILTCFQQSLTKRSKIPIFCLIIIQKQFLCMLIKCSISQ